MTKNQYIYIGQYFHIKQKSLPFDLKFGVTDNLEIREHQLSKTKSPIKYMIVYAWKLPSEVNREQVEKLISCVFDEKKYNGCEWYDINNDDEKIDFITKVEKILSILSDMHNIDHYKFEKINFNKSDNLSEKTETTVEDKIRKNIEISTKTKLKVSIADNEIFENTATNTYLKTIEFLIDSYDLSSVKLDDLKFLSKTNNFPEWATVSEYKGYFINTGYSTIRKKNNLNNLFKIMNINGNIEIIEE